MLSKKDNDVLCRVGPGTPMGNLMRQYWLPAFVSSELEADGWPRRIRLLGEDLIAYRDTQGRVGVIDENCPHRGSSMIFARNEEGGVRCAYHGWKFDCSGTCVDMPSEGAESNFKEKVKIKAYKTGAQRHSLALHGPATEGPAAPARARDQSRRGPPAPGRGSIQVRPAVQLGPGPRRGHRYRPHSFSPLTAR